MADAKRCDRCGQFYIYSSETHGCKFYSAVENRERLITSIGNNYTDFDICPECWAKFREFMENKPWQET